MLLSEIYEIRAQENSGNHNCLCSNDCYVKVSYVGPGVSLFEDFHFLGNPSINSDKLIVLYHEYVLNMIFWI